MPVTMVKPNQIVWEVEQLKEKIKILGSLRRFQEIAKKGRRFAKARKIRPQDVLKDD